MSDSTFDWRTLDYPAPYRATADVKAETWIDALAAEEARTLSDLQSRVACAVRGLISPDVAKWLAEETLWQIASLLADTGRLALPEVGAVELIDGPEGPILLATASPAVRGHHGAREEGAA